MPLSPKQSDSESTAEQETAAAVLDSGRNGTARMYAGCNGKEAEACAWADGGGRRDRGDDHTVRLQVKRSWKKIRKNRRTVSRKVILGGGTRTTTEQETEETTVYVENGSEKQPYVTKKCFPKWRAFWWWQRAGMIPG